MDLIKLYAWKPKVKIHMHYDNKLGELTILSLLTVMIV